MEYIDFSFQTGVCIGARLCVQETGELNLWRFMHWSKQFFCLIMVVFLLEGFGIISFNGMTNPLRNGGDRR